LDQGALSGKWSGVWSKTETRVIQPPISTKKTTPTATKNISWLRRDGPYE
jgi:hypothetical protein